MTISGIQPPVRSLAFQASPRPVSPVATSFGQALASVTPVSSGTAASKLDVTSMTTNQMDGFAQRLYGEGKIGLTQLFKLQNAGPLRGSDPTGAAARKAYGNAPIDYIAYAQDQMAGIASRGGVNDPKAGYQDWSEILSVLQATRLQA